MDDELLSEELLLLFERRLREAGSPVARVLQPGLSDAELDVLAATLPVRLPEELRTWYRWHNGLDPSAADWTFALGNGRFLTSLQDSLLSYQTCLITWECEELADEFTYRPSWWPIAEFDNVDYVVADTAGEPGGPCPVHAIGLRVDKSPDWNPVRAPSLGAMVRLWIQAIDDGWWRWDDDGRRIDTYQELPEHLIDTELI
jgi:cell wall assembly regulator SMI1